MSHFHTGCPDCGGFSFVDVHHEGDTVCTNCGLVVQERNIEDSIFYNQHSFDDHEELTSHEPKTRNFESDKKLRMFVNTLFLPDIVEKNANDLFQKIRALHAFRGQPLQAIMACTIYMSCNLLQMSRDAKEIYEPLGINLHVFHKALKNIYELLPEVNMQMKRIQEDDIIVRQVQQLVPNEKKWTVIRLVKHLDGKRKDKSILMGSPPSVVNAILIFIACEKLKININKTEYLLQARVSRATLDKHTRTIYNTIHV